MSKRERIVADELVDLADGLDRDGCPALADMWRNFAQPIVDAHDAGVCACPEGGRS